MGILATIGNAIADRLIPIVAATLEKHAAVLIPKVGDTISAEIERRIPMIIEAVVVAVTKTMGELAINTTDRFTDAIPGQLDDQIIDPLVSSIVDEFRERFGIKF